MFVQYGITCKHCGIVYVVDADPYDVKDWNDGKFIQDALPYLTAGERELFISGTCDDCWKDLFGWDSLEEEDDENINS